MTRNIKDLYSLWLDAVNLGKWREASQLVGSAVIYNDKQLTNEEFSRQVQEDRESFSDKKTTLDMCIIGNNNASLATRLIHSATLPTSPSAIEWEELSFCWFKDEKLVKVTSLTDVDAKQKQTASVPRTPSLDRKPAPSGFSIENTYEDYIHAINTLTMKETFPRFCQPTVTHNTRSFSMDEYRIMIEDSFRQIKGLNFTITELVADDASQQVASRLEFTGKPVEEFVGIQPTGRDVNFWEHAFYQLDEGKIVRVWSILDLDSYRKCLSASD